MAAALVWAAWAAVLPVHAGSLEGQALLNPPFPLPPGAVLDVQLLERPLRAGPSVLRGRSRFATTGRPPLTFVVPYLDAAVIPGHRHTVRATVHQADRLLFRAEAPVRLGVAGQEPLRLTLLPVEDAPLRGLLWLRAPAAGVPAPPEAPRQEQQFRLDPLTRELTGSADCNRFVGTYSLQGDNLRLDPAAGTMLACEPEVQADERRFLADLLRVRRWRLDSQGRLALLDEQGSLVLLMETRPG